MEKAVQWSHRQVVARQLCLGPDEVLVQNFLPDIYDYNTTSSYDVLEEVRPHKQSFLSKLLEGAVEG